MKCQLSMPYDLSSGFTPLECDLNLILHIRIYTCELFGLVRLSFIKYLTTFIYILWDHSTRNCPDEIIISVLHSATCMMSMLHDIHLICFMFLPCWYHCSHLLVRWSFGSLVFICKLRCCALNKFVFYFYVLLFVVKALCSSFPCVD